jgi:transcription elongation GreA/GreB family factor
MPQTSHTPHLTLSHDALVIDAGDHEVEVGDLVSYIDVDQDSNAIITMRITEKTQDVSAGLIAQHTPLAQVLLGAMVGDAVVLRVPGQPPRALAIRSIARAARASAASS